MRATILATIASQAPASGHKEGTIPDLLYRSANLVVRCMASGDTSRWAVTFQSFTTIPDLDAPAFGETYLASRGISCIAVSCAGNDWYQYDDMPAALAAIRARVAGAERVMTYGSSMGGYAAIRFADAVGANACLALSPQYSNDRRKVPFEWRWGQQSRTIRWRDELDGPIRCGFAPVVIYDTHAEDGMQVRRIAQDIPILAVPLPYTAHPVATYLHTAGILDGAVMAVLAGTFDAEAFTRAARARRGHDAIYLAELGSRQPAWRPRLGLALARAAVASAPHYAVVACQLARRLSASGEHAEALALYEQVMRTNEFDAGFALPYSEALVHAGQLDEALALVRRIVSGHHGMAHMHSWFAHLLWATDAMDEAIAHAVIAHRAAPYNWHYRKTLWHYRYRRLRRTLIRGAAMLTGRRVIGRKDAGHA